MRFWKELQSGMYSQSTSGLELCFFKIRDNSAGLVQIRCQETINCNIIDNFLEK